jgi:hypothetical protein
MPYKAMKCRQIYAGLGQSYDRPTSPPVRPCAKSAARRKPGVLQAFKRAVSTLVVQDAPTNRRQAASLCAAINRLGVELAMCP